MNTAPAIELDTWRTPGGLPYNMAVRAQTSDWNTVNACAGGNDEYRLPKGLAGWALDVGAHIGAVTVPLLLDNPDLHCISIEAIPENVELLRMNLKRNGIEARCRVVEGAAGASGATLERIGYSPDAHHRYIGSVGAQGDAEIMVPVTSLRAALNMAPPRRIVWAKIDCEGCEYTFFDERWVGDIDYIVGEVHFGIERLRVLLDPTHIVVGTEDFGAFTAMRRPGA